MRRGLLPLVLLVLGAKPAPELRRHPCDLDGLADGRLVLDEAGMVWLMDGSRLMAEVDTEQEMWPDRTLVKCSGKQAEVISQGTTGQLQLHTLLLDFSTFL